MEKQDAPYRDVQIRKFPTRLMNEIRDFRHERRFSFINKTIFYLLRKGLDSEKAK